MHDHQRFGSVLRGQRMQPGHPRLTKPIPRIRCVFVEDEVEQRAEFWRPGELALALLGPPEELVGVPHHTRPTELADSIDDLVRARPHQSEVAPVDDEVWSPAV
jgi:hypothetical protein